MNARKAIGPALAIVLLIGVAVAINFSCTTAKNRSRPKIPQHASRSKSYRARRKKIFLSDPELAKVLESEGIAIEVQKSGSREIATRPDLKTFDIAYPAGAHAAVKISQTTGSKLMYPTSIRQWR